MVNISSLVSCDGVTLEFFEQIVDVIVVDLDIRHEHTVAVVFIDWYVTRITDTWTTLVRPAQNHTGLLLEHDFY